MLRQFLIEKKKAMLVGMGKCVSGLWRAHRTLALYLSSPNAPGVRTNPLREKREWGPGALQLPTGSLLKISEIPNRG